MSEPVILLLMVVGAFLASALLARRGGYGFVSGTEYLLFGVLLGPLFLGLVSEETRSGLRPAVTMCIAWLALLLGFRLRRSRLRALGTRGALAVLVEGGGTLIALFVLLPLVWRGIGLHFGEGREQALALALAVVAAASTKSTLSWARAHLNAHGSLTDHLERITRHDDVIAIFGLVLVVMRFRPPGMPEKLLALPMVAVAAAVLGFGLVLGGAFTLLGGRHPNRETAWVLLIGVTFLGAGVASRLALPAMAVCFLIGATISATTLEHALLDEIAAHTERPVVILLLLLLGVDLVPASSAAAGPLVALPVAAAAAVCSAVGLRLVCKLLAGPLLFAPGTFTVWSGAGLLGFGGVAMAGAAQIDLLYGSGGGASSAAFGNASGAAFGNASGAAFGGAGGVNMGTLVLLCACGHALVGDVIGPLALRALLMRRGEAAVSTHQASTKP